MSKTDKHTNQMHNDSYSCASNHFDLQNNDFFGLQTFVTAGYNELYALPFF